MADNDLILKIIAQDQYSAEMKSAREAVDKMTEAEKKNAVEASALAKAELERAKAEEKAATATRSGTEKLQDFGKGAADVGDKLSIGVTLPIVAAGTAVIKFASDLNETQSKVGVLFGDMADDVKQWSDTSATALGISKKAALDGASTFAIFGKSAGLAGTDLTEFSKQNVQLASDMASFFNTSPEEAIMAIGAAFRGESEPIRRYGVLLNEASLKDEALRQGLIKTTSEALTPQQKVLASQALIMQQTTAAQGDFARTSDQLANSTRIAKAQLEDAAAALGTKLLPLVNKGVNFINGLLEAFQQLSPEMQDAIIAFAGIAAAMGPVLSIGGRMIGVLTTIGPKAIDAAKGLGAIGALEMGVLIAGLIAIAKYLGEVDVAAKATTDDLLKMANSGDIFQQAAASTEILTHGQDRLKVALDGVNEKLKAGADGYADYRTSIEATAQAAGYLIDAQGNLILARSGELVQANYALTESEYNLIKAQKGAASYVDASDRALRRQAGSTSRAIPLTKEQTSGMLALAEANRIAAADTEANVEKMDRLQALMAGPLKSETESYTQQQDDLKTRAAEISAELDKLNASQGRAVTTQKENTLSAAELNLATQQLSKAQGDLSAATDPLKQAELAVKIEDLQGKIGGASSAVTSYIDNSKKIGELQGEYDSINKAIEANAVKHEEATKRILFGFAQQQLSADGLSRVEAEALNQLAKDFGLIDEKTATAFDKTLKATSQLAEDQSIKNFLANMKGVYEEVDGVVNADILKINEQQKALEAMGKTAAGNVTYDLNSLESKGITPATIAAAEHEQAVIRVKEAWIKVPTSWKTVYTIETKGEIPGGGTSTQTTPIPTRALGGPVSQGLYYLHDNEFVLSEAMRRGTQAIPSSALMGGVTNQRTVNHVNNFYDTLSTAMWLEQQRQEELSAIAAVM